MMRKCMVAGLILHMLVRLLPGFADAWAQRFSRLILRLAALMGDRLPFVLLEAAAIGICAYLLVSLFRKAFLKKIARMAVGFMIIYLLIWHPLYFVNMPEYSAAPAEIAASCREMIGRLNLSPLDFPLPDDLPAKPARFPGWMRALNIGGLGSFITGDAIYSPDLADCALPFVAVHERMHIAGIADEGAANIAAWQDCLRRGGAYADSARLWAVRYSMGLLRRADLPLYLDCLNHMNEATLQAYLHCGGDYLPEPPPAPLQIIYEALGIEAAMQDYEILAIYLAAELAQ